MRYTHGDSAFPAPEPVTFAMYFRPQGATLSGPLYNGRQRNQFADGECVFVTVNATTAAGGKRHADWERYAEWEYQHSDVVTPLGGRAVRTRWPRILGAGACTPPVSSTAQTGSLLRNGGVGFNPMKRSVFPMCLRARRWLGQVGARACNYWIAPSDLDFGEDIIGVPVSVLNSP